MCLNSASSRTQRTRSRAKSPLFYAAFFVLFSLLIHWPVPSNKKKLAASANTQQALLHQQHACSFTWLATCCSFTWLATTPHRHNTTSCFSRPFVGHEVLMFPTWRMLHLFSTSCFLQCTVHLCCRARSMRHLPRPKNRWSERLFMTIYYF